MQGFVSADTGWKFVYAWEVGRVGEDRLSVLQFGVG